MTTSAIQVKCLTPLSVSFGTFIDGMASSTTTGAQSTYIDLGATNVPTGSRAEAMLLRASIAFTTAPASGSIDFYVGFSSATNASFPANLTGAAAAYGGYATNLAAQGLPHLTMVGTMTAALNTSVQTKDIGTFTPLDRYVVVVAMSSVNQVLTTTTTDKVFKIIPLQDEVAAAA